MLYLSRQQICVTSCTDVQNLKSLPAKTIANNAKPTARGPITPKEGLPTATAYTTDTRINVMMVSHPNSIPAVQAQQCPMNACPFAWVTYIQHHPGQMYVSKLSVAICLGSY